MQEIEEEINILLDKLKEVGYSKSKLIEIMTKNKMDTKRRLEFLRNYMKRYGGELYGSKNNKT